MQGFVVKKYVLYSLKALASGVFFVMQSQGPREALERELPAVCSAWPAGSQGKARINTGGSKCLT